MSNNFLKVNKDLFNLGLAPIDILIVAQIMEFQTNTNDCFISNEKLAEQFGVSESTVKRSLDKLVKELKIVVRDTKNCQKGKDRHMKVNVEKIEELARAKMNLAKEEDGKTAKAKMNLAEGSKCTLRKEQNEPIKDKSENITLKDNFTSASNEALVENNPEAEEEGSQNNPIYVEKEWLAERYNNLTELANGLFMYNKKYYKIKENK